MSTKAFPWVRQDVLDATPARRISATLAWMVPTLIDLSAIERVVTDDPHLVEEANAIAINLCKIVAALLALDFDTAELVFRENEALMASWAWKSTSKHAPSTKQ